MPDDPIQDIIGDWIMKKPVLHRAAPQQLELAPKKPPVVPRHQLALFAISLGMLAVTSVIMFSQH